MPHCSCIVFIISPRQHAAANGCEVVSFLGMLTLMSVFLSVSCPNVWPRALAASPFTTIFISKDREDQMSDKLLWQSTHCAWLCSFTSYLWDMRYLSLHVNLGRHTTARISQTHWIPQTRWLPPRQVSCSYHLSPRRYCWISQSSKPLVTPPPTSYDSISEISVRVWPLSGEGAGLCLTSVLINKDGGGGHLFWYQ